MGSELAKDLLDRGQHDWLLSNPCRGHLGADKQATGDSCAHKVWAGMTIDLRLVPKMRGSRAILWSPYPSLRRIPKARAVLASGSGISTSVEMVRS